MFFLMVPKFSPNVYTLFAVPPKTHVALRGVPVHSHRGRPQGWHRKDATTGTTDDPMALGCAGRVDRVAEGALDVDLPWWIDPN